REINALISPFGLEAISAGALGLPEPAETETSFAGNAAIKSHAAARASGLPALADDSGLEVAALGGQPGIHSARWGGPEKDFDLAMQKVEDALQAVAEDDQTNREANFTCVLCLAWPDGHVDCFEGRVFGDLVWPARGEHGFGYDPVFVPRGDSRTFAEMDPDEKHAISHRARAFEQLVEACFRDT
ncbi:MAG: non-canonical purine NTP pyrophosphatase, partial [Rhodospirillales bacterium]